MTERSAVPKRPRSIGAWWLASLALGACPAGAQNAGSSIYSCVDAQGKRHTSDRPILECQAREQNVLNPDGSVRRTLPPSMTPEEREAAEARERQAAVERSNQQDALRRDRNLLARYPNEAAHARARAAALDDARKSIEQSGKRLAALAVERKPLTDEAEFYVGRPMPTKLRQALDANDAATEAQRASIANQQAETVRIDALFDTELTRLRRLWAGSAPGSMGVIAKTAAAPGPSPASSPASAAASGRKPK